MVSLGLVADLSACGVFGCLKRHSMRYRACSGGSSVVQANRVRLPSSVRVIGVRKGSASALMEVSIPQAEGASSAGKSNRTLSRRVGSRTARWNHCPHLMSLTV
jgi:hypothetical protein